MNEKTMESAILDALEATRLSDAEICRSVDMRKLLAQFPTVQVRRIGHFYRVELPGDETWETWVYNPADGLFRDSNGMELDKIAFYTRLTGLSREEAALALASDPSIQHGEDNKDRDRAPAQLPPWTLEDLDLILPDTEWLWQHWLPKGFVTLLVGEPGVGKSALALAVAGIVAQGGTWPSGQASEPGLVVWVESEAAHAILRERATKWGLPKVCFLLPSTGDDPLEHLWLDSRRGWEALEREVAREGVRLVVVDSLRGAYRGDENASVSIALLNRLAALARDKGIAVLVVHHLRKRGLLDGKGLNLDRVRGSSAIVQIPRCVWAIDAPDPLTPEVRRLQQLKNNLAPLADPLGFVITPSGVQWREAPTEPKTPSQREQAADLLLTLLKKGPVPAQQIYREAEFAGISAVTVKRAKKALGIVAVRREGRWWWSLPAQKT